MTVTHLFRVLRSAIACQKLVEIGDEWTKYDVIGIDEGQFFEDVSGVEIMKTGR